MYKSPYKIKKHTHREKFLLYVCFLLMKTYKYLNCTL